MAWVEGIRLVRWLPDLFTYELPDDGLSDACNVLSLETGLIPVPAMSQYNVSGNLGTDANKPPLFAKEFIASNGNCYIIVGTQNKLYRINPNKSIDDVSGTTYNASSWCFTQSGDWIIATDYIDNVQVLKTFQTASNFVNLGGSPPKAKFCLYDSGHLILAHLENEPRSVQWSAYRNLERWGSTPITGAGKQFLEEGRGEITGLIKTGRTIAIFFNNSIIRGQYVGYDPSTGWPITYKFAKIEDERGALHNNLILPIGSSCFYWDTGDIYLLQEQSMPIGAGVRKLFFEDTNYSIDRTNLNLCSCCYDQNRDLIIFQMKMRNGQHRLLFYNHSNRAWTYGNSFNYQAFMFHPDGNLLNMPKLGGFSYINGAWHMVAETTNDYGSMNIRSKEIKSKDMTMIKTIRLHRQYKSSIVSPTVNVYHRNSTHEDFSYTTFIPDSVGHFVGRASGRNFIVEIVGDENALGAGLTRIDIEFEGASIK